MWTTIWRFTVHPQRIEDFERHYASNGPWARLFARSPGFIGTELFRSTSEKGVYITMDTWESEAAFDAFKRVHKSEYDAVDRECESMTIREHRVT